MVDKPREELYPWRRFWARILDWSIGSFFFGFVIAFALLFYANIDEFQIGVALEWMLDLVGFMIWVPIEATLLINFGTTPGKWLLSIDVKPNGNSLPSWTVALRRSWLVLMRGAAFNIPIINLGAFYLSYEDLMRQGASYWDRSCNTHLIVLPIRRPRIVIFVILLAILRLLPYV